VAEGDDNGSREAVGVGELLAIAVEVGGTAGEPLVDRGEAAIHPGGLGILDRGRPQGEPLGVQRAIEHRPARGRRCSGGADVEDVGTDVAQGGEHSVQLGLVGDLPGEAGGAVIVAGDGEVGKAGPTSGRRGGRRRGSRTSSGRCS
jgi:hypothetical protein